MSDRGQHINTFEKGMTSDVSIIYQPNGTYRYMKNCQLISQDGNNFVIKDCLGNTKIFELNIPYLDYGLTTPATLTSELNPMSIGFISFPDKLIVLSTNNETDGGGYGEIGVLSWRTYGEGIQPLPGAYNWNTGYIPLYGHQGLKFSKMHRIEGFAYEETTEIQRIYWTDNNNEPRVLNVADPIFSSYYISGALVNGVTYMVIQGVIEYPVLSGKYYGPSNGTSNISNTVTGNTFTAGATNNYTAISPGQPLVIKYYPIQLLNFTPSRSMGDMRFKNYGTGSVYCGTKIYFHRLSKPTEGVYTSWSYGAAPIHVGTINSTLASPANPFFDFTGGGSSSVLLNSGKSVTITIDNIDTAYDNIEVAVAEFDQSLEVIRSITVIANEFITGSSMDITHTGSSNLGELTLGDITLFPASILKCKTLTTNKNYILIGNITERTEFSSFSISNITISQIQHKIRSHQSEYGAAGTPQVCENVLSYNLPTNSNVNPSTVASPAPVGGIQPYTQWVVIGGVAGVNYVTYNGVNYGAEPDGQVFTGVPGAYNYTVTGVGITVRPCVSRNRYTTNPAAIQPNKKRPDFIQFATNDTYQWNYKNPAVASHVKGYWSSETYRFGILFFDLKGNPFYVRWIGDKTFDNTINVPLSELIQVDAGGDNDWYLNQNGLTISGIEIPATLIDKISGFSIVRAERDATIMTQGMLMQTTSSNPSGLHYNLPSANIINCDSAFQVNDYNTFTYICPDKLVDYPVSNYTTGSRISFSHWVRPRVVSGVITKCSSDGYEATESKYFQVEAVEASPDPSPNYNITAIQDLSEGASVTNFGPSNVQYFNRQQFAAVIANPPDPLCKGAGPANLTNCWSTGGPRTLVEVEGTVYGYNTYGGTKYGALGSASNDKMMANVTVVKSNLYGGQSPAALANTFYISTGHFQPITAAVKADTFNGVDKYIFNEVEIYGGDCYNCIFDYGHSLYDTGFPAGTAFPSNSWGIKFACQSNANIDLRRGRSIAGNRMYPAATGIVMNDGAGNVRLEGFSYNKGYSSQGIPFLYPALPVNFAGSGQFKFRIRYGGQKFPAETIDSFRVFPALDFKDTDGLGGEINNLKTKDGRTIVWQNRIVSSVPILERIINTSAEGAPTTLGTGGVAQRFDPITSNYGNQHQWSVTEFEDGYFWFDMRKKAFMALDFGGGVQELSNIDGLKGFFDELFLEVIGNTSPSLNVVNSQTYAASSDRPLQGVGITGAYDPKFKMSYLTFKFYTREDLGGGKVRNIAKDITLGYYHPRKMFVSFYDWTPSISHTHGQVMFSVKNPQMKTRYYGVNMDSTDFIVGDIVEYKNAEYICVAPVTIASYPGTAPQIPDAAGSAYWYLINKTNEIYAHNQPIALAENPAPDYEYSKFFNQVVDGEVDIVVNPKTNNPFSVLNIEQIGNNENITDIYLTADNDSASDTNITSTSRYYKVIYNAITSSVPLNSNGSRLTDMFLRVKLYKKNWSLAPYDRSRNPKILSMLKSFFEENR